MRLSLDKNADEMGVVIDDTNVITAIYGYGAMTGEGAQRAPLTFANVVWQQTSDHPAKPAGQTYLEDPAATAAYGRNGRPRYGYYQNTDINDANVLIEKAWESLKCATSNTDSTYVSHFVANTADESCTSSHRNNNGMVEFGLKFSTETIGNKLF